MTASNPTVGEPINPADKPGGATYTGSKRPLYFTEQFLVVEDFKDAEHYHLGLSHRHNRGLHAPGVVAGLEVTIQAKLPASGETQLTVGGGIALDNFGREIVLAASATIAFDAPAGNYERYVTISFKEVKSTDESDTKVPTGGRPGVKRAVHAPLLQVTDTDPRTKWPRDPDDDTVLIGKLIKDGKTRVRVAPDQAGAGARIPTNGALSFQQTIADPADINQRTALPIQAALDFADGALRIRARVTDPLNLDATHLVIQQASGNVGIGTINPDAKLTIQQSDDSKKALSIYNAAGDAGIDFLADSITAAGKDQPLKLAVKGAGALLLNPAGGPVGIRTGALMISDYEAVKKAIRDYQITSNATPPITNYKGSYDWETGSGATEGVYYEMKVDSAKGVSRPRLIITGDVIILGRLLVTDISEYGGKMFQRGGRA